MEGPAQLVRDLEGLRQRQDRYTRKQLAAKLGRTHQWWDKVARGDQNLTVEDAERVAAVLAARLDVRAKADPIGQVEAALREDPALFDHSRQVILAAYHRARRDGDARSKGRAATSR